MDLLNYAEIDHIDFSFWSSEEIKKYSVVEIFESKLSGDNTVNDDKLGVIQHNSKCVTCGLDTSMCVGHFGHINLNVPVCHFKFSDQIIKALMCFCYNCKALIIDEQELTMLGLSKYKNEKRYEQIVKYIDVHNKVCRKCFSSQPKYKYYEGKYYKYFNKATSAPEIKSNEIYEIFKKITDKDLLHLGLNQDVNPVNLIMTVCPVLPKPDRPYVETNNIISDDDLTTKYTEIIKFNSKLNNPDLKETERNELISKLEFHIQTLFDNSKKKSKPIKGRPYKCLSERMNGKKGIFRNNLIGKRCDFTCRSPIGGDPNVRADEVVIPKCFSEKLTFPEYVCDFNIDKMRKLINTNKANVVIRTEKDAKGIVRENRYHLKMKLNKYTYETEGFVPQNGDIIIRGNVFHDYSKVKKPFPLLPTDQIKRDGKIYRKLKLPEIQTIELEIGDVIVRSCHHIYNDEQSLVITNPNEFLLFENSRSEPSGRPSGVFENHVYKYEPITFYISKNKELLNKVKNGVKFHPSKFHPLKVVDKDNKLVTDRTVKNGDKILIRRETLNVEKKEDDEDTSEEHIDIEQLRLEGKEYIYKYGDRLFRKGKELLNFNVLHIEPIDIKIGDKIERQLVNGDVVYLGRQPSLHIGSIFARKVKILDDGGKWKNMRFQLSQCKSYNADFDGDEMNLHIPQSYASKAELVELSSTSALIKSTQNGSLFQNLCQDSLVFGYYFTYKEYVFRQEDFFDACLCIELFTMDVVDRLDQVYRTLKLLSITDSTFASRKKYCALNLFSLLFPPDFEYNYNDVYITRGILIRGILDKSVLGSGFNSIPHRLDKEYGSEVCIQFFSNFQILTGQLLYLSGFSIGFWDCAIEDRKDIDKKLQLMYIENDSVVNIEKNLQSRENKLVVNLGNTVKEGEKIVKNSFSEDNPLVIIVNSGAKGSFGNLSQITSIVGQQCVDGKRMTKRLPFYPQDDTIHDEDLYECQGFVKHSYIQGLNPIEFFLHAQGGREGVIDTAVKTARSGYIQRKLTKKMEDLVISYSGFVTNAKNEVVQFMYANGIDPSCVTLNNGKQFFINPLNIIDKINNRVEDSRVIIEENAEEDVEEEEERSEVIVEEKKDEIPSKISKVPKGKKVPKEKKIKSEKIPVRSSARIRSKKESNKE